MTHLHIVSRDEARAIGLKRYFTGEACRQGHLAERTTSEGKCVECVRARDRARQRAQSEEKKAYLKDYYQKNRRRMVAQALEYQRRNPDQRRQTCARYYDRNAGVCSALRHARVKAKTPTWLGEDQKRQMVAMYRAARALTRVHGRAYHVDHIVPINGENVSGLHVPWNLQVITASENARKSNRCDGL